MKFGWSPKGKKAVRLHFQINGKQYSVIAAYSMFGFIAWEIFEGSVTQNEFQHFLTGTLRPFITNDTVGLFDNASIHKTVDCFELLERIFHGGFMFCPAYSSDLKPIELGFSNVKTWTNYNEDLLRHDPIGTINQAFELYSIRSEHGVQTGKCISIVYKLTNITSIATS